MHPSGRITGLTNTNKLIRYYKGCDAGKTGSTSEAGYCIAASANKNDMRIITVVIGAESGAKRFSESASLLDWAYANYENKKIFTQGQELEPITVEKSKVKEITPILEEGYSVVTKKGTESNITTKVDFNDNLSAPIKKGEKIGTAYVLKDNVVLKEINILSSCDANKISYFEALKEVLDNVA